MDIRNLHYPANLFDMVIDKSTGDTLLCGENAFMNTAKMLKVNKKFIFLLLYLLGMLKSLERRRSIYKYFIWYT